MGAYHSIITSHVGRHVHILMLIVVVGILVLIALILIIVPLLIVLIIVVVWLVRVLLIVVGKIRVSWSITRLAGLLPVHVVADERGSSAPRQGLGNR